ncbi:Retrovirus-related Pol polyprotein from transposon TNT 1-94 [Fusarium oxysporum f. sp. matthiolae]|nr:Retrovirus-related Pol polyprotein from transposon TNT 1-94 [Fusarium oxysporum f. sp. matthiolae]
MSDGKDSNLSGNLSGVAKLESSEGWINWNEEIRDLLALSGYDDLLERKRDPPVQGNLSDVAFEEKLDAWHQRQARACGAVRYRLGFRPRQEVQGLNNLANILKTLEQHFKPKGSSVFHDLQQKFDRLTLGNCENVSDFSRQLRKSRDQVLQLDETSQIGQPQLIDKFLNGLGPKYQVFLTAFLQSHSLLPERNLEGIVTKAATTIEEATRAAEQEEHSQRMQQQDQDQETIKHAAMVAAFKEQNFTSCSYCKKLGHTSDACWLLHPELKKRLNDKRFRRKQRQDHPRTNNRTRNADEDEVTNALAIHAEPVIQLMAYQAELRCTPLQRENFSTLHPWSGGQTVGIGETQITPQGLGNYILRLKGLDGPRHLALDNSVYSPEGRVNLVSISALTRKGAKISFGDNQSRVAYDNQVILTATVRSGIYVVDQPDEAINAALASLVISDPELQIWHERLGHLSENGIKALKGMAHGIHPILRGENCEPCIVGKQKERPHQKSIRKGTYPLECVHADIAGPFPDTAYDGSRYWVVFVDDFTRMGWAYAVREKSEFTRCFKYFLDTYERPERRCHYLHVDQGGENRSDQLCIFCDNKGISIYYTATDQHEQNGIAEAFNRVLQEKVTPTLERSNLPRKLWPYILYAAVYIRNRSPSKALNKTPYEAWFGDKPDLSHLRVIGANGWAILPSAKRQKLRAKTIQCRLLGYQGSSNYIVVDNNSRVFIANNVIFDESSFHEATGTPTGSKRTRSEGPTLYPEPEPSPKKAAPPRHDAIPQVEEIISEDETGTIHVRTSEPHHDLTGPTDWDKELRVSQRSTKAKLPSRYLLLGTNTLTNLLCAHVNLAASLEDEAEPRTIKEAQDSLQWENWLEGMTAEMDSIKGNGVYTLAKLPPDRKALRGKWVFKLKRGANGEILRFKARYVVRGFEQQEGVDYNETFASVVKPMTYKAIFAIAAALDLELEQMDVKTAFLYGNIDEEIYVGQPEGFDDGTGRVWELRKALYGLKQSPRIWYQTLSLFLQEQGFQPLVSDMGVFVNGQTYIAVYVDDLLIAGPSKRDIEMIKRSLNQRFSMTDLGPCHFYLGMSITRNRRQRRLSLSQKGYIEKVLKEFGLWDSKPTATPVATAKLEPALDDEDTHSDRKHWYAKAIGCLMYAMLGTRPDIAFGVSLCSRYLANPTKAQEAAVKRIMRYLRGTCDFKLEFRGDIRPLTGYTDSDWAGDTETRRSTAGYIFNVGSGAISWAAKRQQSVALSTCEAEYMGQTQATKEAIWLRTLLKELLGGLNATDQIAATIIYGDNQGAIAMTKNPQYHSRTKHIAIQEHFVREKTASGEVEMNYIPTDKQVADGLTKALPKDRFQLFRKALGVVGPDE